ncbi:hypothetical protein OE88DRAFT_1668670 [Heliocybe sulcata]|uniref:Uncharacterized protein n=1 Tax=Heliocybe sulcata TaxID=5364 RepID=A0A5C3MK76_9AGAM|nr:hypothetical protein OE88DRAFT_1668670 [Heliocybe sulcata]
MDPNPSRQIVEPSGGVILRQLFDFDSGLSMEEHLQVYEDAKHRWTHCSLEEWQAGAEGVWMESSFFLLGADLSVTLELMGKFGDVMDYVKDHLHTKMSLYASLHSRVEEHKGTLGNRDKILQDVRERLVRQSGNVLGSGIAS